MVFDREPVQRTRGDRGKPSGSSQKACRSILDKLQSMEKGRLETEVEGITVVQSRGHKGMNNLLRSLCGI